ncbi:hypothetical protein B0H19DRAFT_954746, partial [Mycena capillaripes]
MPDLKLREKGARRTASQPVPQPEASRTTVEEIAKPKITGRHSELTSTVDKNGVLDRILDTQVPMSLRELMVTSKELRTDFQDLIKVKNVCAVLLGNSCDHPLIANATWPRSEGILIKIDMKTEGREVCAIVDTGSQLDIVRDDV